MERTSLPRELRPFIDEFGRLTQWPARHRVQRMAVALLASRFEAGRDYSEKDVNALLQDGHTFADWAILRRSLVDWRFMSREEDGSRYRLLEDAAGRIARELGTATSLS
jgi:hypothetical protein